MTIPVIRIRHKVLIQERHMPSINAHFYDLSANPSRIQQAQTQRRMPTRRECKGSTYHQKEKDRVAVHSSQQAEAARQAMTHYEPVSKRTTNPIGMMTKLRRNTTKTPRSCPHMLLSESALAAVSISSLDAPHRAAQPLMRFSVHQNGQRSENDNPNSG